MTDKKKHGIARGLTNYGDADFSLYLRRSFAKSMGYSAEMLARPVVGIAQSASGFNNCHRHFPELVEAVKRGVLAAGGLPLDFPTISLGEVFLNPTSMMFRNLMAMDVGGNDPRPADGRGGADRRLRQDRAGAVDGRGVGRSAGHPARRRPDAADGLSRRAPRRLHRLPALLGQIPRQAKSPRTRSTDIEGNLATTAGSCAVMGTASTMAAHRRGAGHDACPAPRPFPRSTPTACAPPRRAGAARWR